MIIDNLKRFFAVAFVGTLVYASLYAPIHSYLFLNNDLITGMISMTGLVFSMLGLMHLISVLPKQWVGETQFELEERKREPYSSALLYMFIAFIIPSIGFVFLITKTNQEIEGKDYRQILSLVKSGPAAMVAYKEINGTKITYIDAGSIIYAAEYDRVINTEERRLNAKKEDKKKIYEESSSIEHDKNELLKIKG